MSFLWLALLLGSYPEPPPGFLDLHLVVPEARIEVRYATEDNFLGRVVDGYRKPRIFLTHPAARALGRIQEQLRPFGLGLKVFDAYRPQRAVDHFVRWSQDPTDAKGKAAYYPDIPKADLFPKGYIARRSGHSRGSTVDLTLVDLATSRELDMGSPYDFFGPVSAPDSSQPSAPARAHRLLLRTLMLQQGFRPLAEEWWHFTFGEEPFPDTYFDFEVE